MLNTIAAKLLFSFRSTFKGPPLLQNDNLSKCVICGTS